jgi:hypothetical protein
MSYSDNSSTNAELGETARRHCLMPNDIVVARAQRSTEDIIEEYRHRHTNNISNNNIGSNNANESDGTTQSNERSDDNNNQEASSHSDGGDMSSVNSVNSMAANFGTQRFDDGDQGNNNNNNNVDAPSVGDVEMKDASSDEEDGGGGNNVVQQQQRQQQQRRRNRRRNSENLSDIANDRGVWTYGIPSPEVQPPPEVQPRMDALASPPNPSSGIIFTGGCRSTPLSERTAEAEADGQQNLGNEEEKEEAVDNIGKEAVDVSNDNAMDVEVEVGEREGETEGGLVTSPIRPTRVHSSGGEGVEGMMVEGVHSLRLNTSDEKMEGGNVEGGVEGGDYEEHDHSASIENIEALSASVGCDDVNMVSRSNFLILSIFCLILS